MVKNKTLILIAGLLLSLSFSSSAQLRTYKKADSCAALYPHHSLKDLNVLSQRLTSGLTTDEDKFRSIYRWVCTNIATDIELVELNRAKRKQLSGEKLEDWNREINDRMLNLLVEGHRTLCTGYAWLVKELSRRSGIHCEIINGYGRRMGSNVTGPGFANHSWNAVKLNGEWRLCDPTWSAGFVDLATGTFRFQFEDAYFLTDPEYFIRNHYPADTSWTLVKITPDLETFLNDVLVHAGAIRYKVSPWGNYRMIISAGGETGFFLHTAYRGPMSYVIGSSEPRPMIMNTLKDGGQQFWIRHTFKRRGTYPVHILVDDKFIASYEVTVR
jgi:hypothetical protein